jgi:hypothetical protein
MIINNHSCLFTSDFCFVNGWLESSHTQYSQTA